MSTSFFRSLLGAACGVLLMAGAAEARDQLHIVGSSTVYPFVSAAAEHFGEDGKFGTPIVESIGTGGGFKLFCSGAGVDTPDISNASRTITDDEKKLCEKNGVKEITEVGIGYDGIVLANSLKSPRFNLTKKQLFLVLAKQTPKDGKLVDNPYTKWNEIDPALPAQEIEVYGPPTTSGTRDAFVEIVMEKTCEGFPEFTTAYADEKERKGACKQLRADKRYIDATENDNIIVQKLVSNPTALGIFGYSFLEENTSQVQGAQIEGVDPTFENIADASYKVSRSLYVYVKNSHIGKVPGLLEFVQELTSEDAFGPDGYLADKGLIPLHDDEREKSRQKVATLAAPK